MKLELKHLVHYLPYGLRCKNGNTTFEMTGSFLDEWYNYGEIPKDLKTILRPISDLIKPEHILGMGFRTMNYDLTLPSFTIKQFEYLFKNHFDVFGLIEQGLAIDINTLTNEN